MCDILSAHDLLEYLIVRSGIVSVPLTVNWEDAKRGEEWLGHLADSYSLVKHQFQLKCTCFWVLKTFGTQPGKMAKINQVKGCVNNSQFISLCEYSKCTE